MKRRMQAVTYTVTVTSQQSGALIGQNMFQTSVYFSDEALWWLAFAAFWLQVLVLALDASLARLWRGLVGGLGWVKESLAGAVDLAGEVWRCFDAGE
jgi:hypothetical protein